MFPNESRQPQAVASPGPPDAGVAESELRALISVSAAVASAHRLEDVLETVAEETRRVTGAASVHLSRWDRERGLLVTLVNVGDLADWEERFPEDENYALSDFPHCVELLERGVPYVSAIDDPGTPAKERDGLLEIGKESCLAVPIIHASTTWGQLELCSAPGEPRFAERQVAFAQTIARQVAAAIDRAQLFSRLAAMAYQDPLTGLANRRALEQRLDEAVLEASAHGAELAVMFCDLDGLKSLNDMLGHEAGDSALRTVSDALTGVTATIDGAQVSRVGGDEFCVLLPGLDADAARMVARSALEALDSAPALEALDSARAPVSLSFGIASYGPRSQSVSALLRAADAAQYAAKRSGQGRVFVADANGDHESSELLVPGRRDYRERPHHAAMELHRLMERCGPWLDSRREESILQRLELIAGACEETLCLSGWSISHLADREEALNTLRVARGGCRETGTRALRFSVDDEEYAVASYPATAGILAEGGAFLIHVGDPAADPAERDLLQQLDFVAVLALAARNADGAYLLELFADAESHDLAPAAAVLRSLVVQAVHPEG